MTEQRRAQEELGARKRAARFSAPLPAAGPAAALLAQALKEITDYVEALGLAEETFRDQNTVLIACLRILQEERRQDQSFLDAVSDAVLITDSRGRIRKANPAARAKCRMYSVLTFISTAYIDSNHSSRLRCRLMPTD